MLYSSQWGATCLKILTVDHEKAHNMMHDFMLNVTPDRALAALEALSYPWHKIMDDATWKTLASAMTEHQAASSNKGRAPIFPETPFDLPPPVAEKRDKFLRFIGNHEDLATRCELTEIVMAAKNGRPADLGLFRQNEHVAQSWESSLCEMSLAEAESEIIELSSQFSANYKQVGADNTAARLRIEAELEEAQCAASDLLKTTIACEPNAALIAQR